MIDVALIQNPISGPRGAATALARFRARLERRGASVRLRLTECAAHAESLAREEAERGADVVVAVGGDGTVGEVARGLLAAGRRDTSLAVLAQGTSNLVARHLGIPFEPEAAADAVLEGEPVTIDVAEADGRVFLACAGVGWDAEVVTHFARLRTGHRGKLGYLRPILRATWSWRPVPVSVVTDDGREASGVMVFVLNMRPYASYFRPSPGACATDGLLDVVVLQRGRFTDLARWALRAWRGTLLEDSHAVLLRTSAVRLTTEEPVAYQIDGDVGARTPVAMLVRPGALRVLRPAGSEARP